MEATTERRGRLQAELDDLRARWPKHSPSAAMGMRLEELEEELAELDRAEQEAG